MIPTRLAAGLAALACAFVIAASPARAADWTPAAWEAEDTLQFRTDCPDEGEYWSWVWLVVLDGEAWVRLGSRAGGRVDCSTSKPMTSIRIAGQEFAQVEMVPVPEMADRVAEAMAAKYPTDVFVRYFSHPYTMKLVPKAEGTAAAAAPAAEAAPAAH